MFYLKTPIKRIQHGCPKKLRDTLNQFLEKEGWDEAIIFIMDDSLWIQKEGWCGGEDQKYEEPIQLLLW